MPVRCEAKQRQHIASPNMLLASLMQCVTRMRLAEIVLSVFATKESR